MKSKKIITCIILIIIILFSFSEISLAEYGWENFKNKYYDGDTGTWNFESFTDQQLKNKQLELGDEFNSLLTYGLPDSETAKYYEVYGAINTELKKRGQKIDQPGNNDQDISTTDSDDEKKAYSVEKICKYVHTFGVSNESQEVKDKWMETLRATGDTAYYEVMSIIDPHFNILTGEEETNNQIYHKIGQRTTNTANNFDDAIGDAESFLNAGNSNNIINAGDLQSFSQNLYNILLTIGIIISVIMGGMLGLKFMTETGPEGKAEVKKLLIPYVVGCVIVFGGFAIWKIVVTILSGI